MKRLAVIANCTNVRAPEVLRKVADAAVGLGLELVADEPTARLLEVGAQAPKDRLFDDVEAVMAIGGDGTMLRVVRELDGRDKPVIGVKLGGLGFLTSVSEDEIDRALASLAAGEVELSEWAVAEGEVVRGGETVARYRALNEFVVNNGTSSRVITLDVEVDGQKVTSYVCDGLIVSTAAGSTGHSLSAGGPILKPQTAALVIGLICPHTLSSRPLVVPDSSRILVTPAGVSADRCTLSVDGQVGQRLLAGDAVRVGRSKRGVTFIHLPGYSYFGVLRQKLHWSGSNV